ncbi:MAG: baseplate assembly protein [Desulfobacterales bacterium]|nr:baseplate assembly protein [Desulfobacterales bacterium]
MDIFGQDIKLDEYLNAVVAANGEFVLTSGAETAVQNIIIRLATPRGSLFYDSEFGSYLHEFIYEENTPTNRMSLEIEVTTRIEESNQVITGSVDVEIFRWDEEGIDGNCSFELINDDHTYNLSMGWITEKKELLIKDVNTY